MLEEGTGTEGAATGRDEEELAGELGRDDLAGFLDLVLRAGKLVIGMMAAVGSAMDLESV